MSYNNGVTYLLIVIDALSKYAWIELLRDKKSKSVADAFACILSRSKGQKPVCFQTDRGKEFIGREMQELLQKNEIQFRVSRSPDTKASIAERIIRTIKEKIWRYFTFKNTKRYIDVVQQIVESYNQSKQSATKMIPTEVTLDNAAVARKNIMKKYNTSTFKLPKYSVDDVVRVSCLKNVFDKGYEGGWSDKLFEITCISSSRPPTVY